jgi:hypothetical protein
VFGTSTGTATAPNGLDLETSGTVTGSNSLLLGYSAINSNTSFSALGDVTLEGQGGDGADGGFGHALGSFDPSAAGAATYGVSVDSNADGQDWGQIVVEVQPIPEPSATLLLLSACGALLLLRRRR